MTVIETPRLRLRRLTPEDAPFVLELVNDPDWLRHIGDRGVRNLDDARDYLLRGPIRMYAERGFGLYLVERKEDGAPAGICGLIKRDALEDVDVGFAFLPAFRGMGYALEAAAATLEHGRGTLGLPRIVAIVSPENHASIRLLEKLGMSRQRETRLTPDAAPVCVFGPLPE